MTNTAYLNTPRAPKGTSIGGEWQAQGHDDSGLICSSPDQADTVDAAEFTWSRIESLMGDELHLDSERTASLPTVGPDDDVSQITRKLIGYVGRTQATDDLDDAQVAAMLGLTLHPETTDMPANLRREFGLSTDARIVVAVDAEGRAVYLSVGNDLKRTGCYRSRYGGPYWRVENLAPQLVARTYRDKLLAQHPELDEREVDRMFDRLTDKRYAAKDYKNLWSESVLPMDKVRFMGAAILLEQAADGEPITGSYDEAQAIFQRVTAMPADEIRSHLARCQTAQSPTGASVYTVGLAYVDTASIEADVNGTSDHARRAAMNRAYRELLTEELATESDFALQRKYVRDNDAAHSATVFEQKQHIPATHLAAAESGYFKESGDFRHVELDADTDLDKLRQVEREYEHLRRFLPKTGHTPTLRFRKTGRHNAQGVYHPHVDNIAVDPRHPSAFVHEFIHHVDHTVGEKNVSSGDGFRPILRAAQQQLAVTDAPHIKKKLDYYRTPTEVLSRTAELYFHWKSPGVSLNDDDVRYGTDEAYTTLAPLRDQIITFWDKTLTDLGAEVPGGSTQGATA